MLADGAWPTTKYDARLHLGAGEFNASFSKRVDDIDKRLGPRGRNAFVLLHPLNRLKGYAASFREFAG